MKTKLIFCALTALALTAPLYAETAKSTDTVTEELSLLQQADDLYAARTLTSGAQQAIALYEQAIAAEPTSSQAHWKAARAYYWLADNTEAKKEKIEWFEKGIALAEKALELEPKSTQAHFWLGALYGTYGESKGVLKSLKLVKPIREHMQAINRIDDRFQGGAGYRVLGVVDYKVPGFAGGSKKRARENLNKAYGIDPENPYNLYYLAEFLSGAGEKQKALELLSKLQKTETSSDVDGPDLERIKNKGRVLEQKNAS